MENEIAALGNGENWFGHNGYSVRVERDGPQFSFQAFKDGLEVLAGIESDGEERVFRVLRENLR